MVIPAFCPRRAPQKRILETGTSTEQDDEFVLVLSWSKRLKRTERD